MTSVGLLVWLVGLMGSVRGDIIASWTSFNPDSATSFSANSGTGTLTISSGTRNNTATDALRISGSSSNIDLTGFSTTGFNSISFRFDFVDRTSNGHTSGTVSATTAALPGSTIATIDFTTAAKPTTYTFSIPALDNSATPKIRLAVSGGSGSDYIEFDNFQIEGSPITSGGGGTGIPEPSQVALLGMLLAGGGWSWRRRRHKQSIP